MTKKIIIPAILAATVLVAGMFALMPVERASTVHTTVLSTLSTLICRGSDAVQGGTLGQNDVFDTVNNKCTRTFLPSPLLVAIGTNVAPTPGYAILAGSAITNTGATAVTGKLGLSPGTSCTGFANPPNTGCTNGAGTTTVSFLTANQNDDAGKKAQLDLTAAYLDAQGRTGSTVLSATTFQLGGTTQTPGVYTIGSGADITGTLTLDGGGNADAVFIFQIGSTLTTASNSNVVLTNGATSKNVFWQIGSSATLGSPSTFRGIIMADQSITVNGSTVDGRLLARSGAVTISAASTITAPA